MSVLPSTDSAAYRDASAINFARGLKGDLLVVHGSGDDNVHYQGTEQLVNALVAAGKQFQMMEYPNRTHGIMKDGTTQHLYNLMTKYLKEHLPAGRRGSATRGRASSSPERWSGSRHPIIVISRMLTTPTSARL